MRSVRVVLVGAALWAAATACSGDDGGPTDYTVARAGADVPRLSVTSTTSIAPEPRAPRVGVSPSFAVFGDDDATLAATMDRIADTGAGWVRVDVDWSYIQRDGPDAWDFAASDRVIEAAVERGMRVIALVAYTPTWARPEGTPDKHPPVDPDDFARFVAAAVAHYDAIGVDTWEIWNEPNIASFWAPEPDPRGYTALLVRASAAIRARQPDATVLTGGLAPGLDRDSMVSPATFLERIYESGGADAFDAVGLHPYSYPYSPLYPADWNAFAITPEVRSVLVEQGDGDRLIWGTEIGAPTAGGDDAVSVDAQAALLADAYEQWSRWDYTGPLIWYAWRDFGTDPLDVGDHFGLVDVNGVAKPALAAFEAVVRSDVGRLGGDGTGVGRGSEHDLEASTTEG